MTALELIKKIVKKNKEISKVSLYSYIYVPLQHEKSPFNRAMWMNRKDFLNSKKVNQIIESLPKGAQLGIYSRVKTIDNKYYYLPMVDFSCKKSIKYINLIIERFKKEDIKHGWIVETAKSYHYYGEELLTYRQWIEFYGKCLCSSIVHTRKNIEQLADTRYIGHTLRRGGAVLRFTTNGDKPFEPKVIKSF